jgi:putative transposase
MKPDVLPTIWEVPDGLWMKIALLLAELDPPKARGRKRVNPRRVLDALIFRMRSGCQWNRLPHDYPDDSSVHRTFQRWVKLQVMDRIWATLVTECADLGGVNWEWQSADGAMGKARMGGTSSAATRRTAAKPA